MRSLAFILTFLALSLLMMNSLSESKRRHRSHRRRNQKKSKGNGFYMNGFDYCEHGDLGVKNYGEGSISSELFNKHFMCGPNHQGIALVAMGHKSTDLCCQIETGEQSVAKGYGSVAEFCQHPDDFTQDNNGDREAQCNAIKGVPVLAPTGAALCCSRDNGFGDSPIAELFDPTENEKLFASEQRKRKLTKRRRRANRRKYRASK